MEDFLNSSKEHTSTWNMYDKKYRHKLFTPYAPWTYPTNWGKNIKWFFKSFRYAAQRIRRGYSNYDLYDLGSYLTGLMAQSLEDFARKTISFPMEYQDNVPLWGEEILMCSRKLFNSIEDMEEYNYCFPPISTKEKPTTLEEIYNEDYFRTKEKVVRDREECCNVAFEWLARHIQELWD